MSLFKKRTFSDKMEISEYTAENMLSACRYFEAQYDVATPVFYERYLEGEFLGIHDAMRWAAYWSAYLELKEDETPTEATMGLVPLDKGISKDLYAILH